MRKKEVARIAATAVPMTHLRRFIDLVSFLLKGLLPDGSLEREYAANHHAGLQRYHLLLVSLNNRAAVLFPIIYFGTYIINLSKTMPMRTFTILFTHLAGMAAFILLTSETKSSSGSPGGHTGSPGDGGVTCTQCHGGTAIVQAGWITSNIPAQGYAPGSTYTITATGTHPGVVRFGMEVTSEISSGTKAGTFIATTPSQNQVIAGGNAITHTASGFTPSGNSKTWTFDWTAPQTGSGTVTFYGAFNAANGNGGTSGDVIYTSSYSVNESIATGLAEASAAQLSLYPVPASGSLNILLPHSNARYDLSDLSGQAVRQGTLVDGKAVVDVSGLPGGLYFLQVEGAAKQSSKVVIR